MQSGKKGSDRLCAHLKAFAEEHHIQTKGALCVVLVVTRTARSQNPPFQEAHFLTPQGGQVAGLGRSAVQSILGEHDIHRVLAEEGGRTSRGSINRMREYLHLLDKLADQGLLDLPAIEEWWVERIMAYFSSKPLRLKVDPSKSLRQIIGGLVEAAFARQKESSGTMVAGAVIQHLVGAKLELVMPDLEIEHQGFSVADAPGGRKGDFLVGDTAVHVTTAPAEALIRKCCDNLQEGLRPLIITTESGAGGAHALARNAQVSDRIDILEIDQFLATNVYEWSGFTHDKRPTSVSRLIQKYNEVVEACETDPSLKISIG